MCAAQPSRPARESAIEVADLLGRRGAQRGEGGDGLVHLLGDELADRSGNVEQGAGPLDDMEVVARSEGISELGAHRRHAVAAEGDGHARGEGGQGAGALIGAGHAFFLRSAAWVLGCRCGVVEGRWGR
jgi:hypothetical protein